MPTAALTSYSVVLALHIIAVIAAFGLPLAYRCSCPTSAATTRGRCRGCTTSSTG